MIYPVDGKPIGRGALWNSQRDVNVWKGMMGHYETAVVSSSTTVYS